MCPGQSWNLHLYPTNSRIVSQIQPLNRDSRTHHGFLMKSWDLLERFDISWPWHTIDRHTSGKMLGHPQHTSGPRTVAYGAAASLLFPLVERGWPRSFWAEEQFGTAVSQRHLHMKGMSRHGSVGLFAAQHRELDVAVGQNMFDPRFSVFNPFLICIPYFGPCPCECSSGEKWPHLSTHHRLPVEVQWCVQDAVRQLTHLMRLCIDFLMLQIIRIMVSADQSQGFAPATGTISLGLALSKNSGILKKCEHAESLTTFAATCFSHFFSISSNCTHLIH